MGTFRKDGRTAVSPVRGHRASRSHRARPRAQGVSHQALHQERDAGALPFLVLHSPPGEDEEGQRRDPLHPRDLREEARQGVQVRHLAPLRFPQRHHQHVQGVLRLHPERGRGSDVPRWPAATAPVSAPSTSSRSRSWRATSRRSASAPRSSSSSMPTSSSPSPPVSPATRSRAAARGPWPPPPSRTKLLKSILELLAACETINKSLRSKKK